MKVPKKRPVGVIIFGWFYIILGIEGFLNFTLVIIMSSSRDELFDIFNNMEISTYTPLIWIGLISLGKGLLNLKPYVRKVTIFLASLCSGIAIIYVVIGKLTFSLNIFLRLFFLFAQLYYLTLPGVKKQFNVDL